MLVSIYLFKKYKFINMKKFIIILVVFLGIDSCNSDKEFLNVPPLNILTQETVFNDPALALSVLGDLYNRAVDFTSLKTGWLSFTDFGESFPSDGSTVSNTTWDYTAWSLYEYGYVRDLNLFIERIAISTALNPAEKSRFIAEARFLRAQYYFEMVKRMGGVPLITKSLVFPIGGDITTFQVARSKEHEVYDFIITESEDIKNSLPNDANTKSRATKAAALALQCRAALYAGSIAKYGAKTPLVSLPGDIVGIPANKSQQYYAKALSAANEIIDGKAGAYKLYNSIPNLSENFSAIFYDKTTSNKESIFVEDFKAYAGKTHMFTTNTQPFSQSEEAANSDAGRLSPSLNLVQSFEKLDNTFSPIETINSDGTPMYYYSITDVFKNRDARLAATVILPGESFKGKLVDVWAGYILSNGTVFTAANSSVLRALPGTTENVQVVGSDGPVDGLAFRTQTGFYNRKYLDPIPQSGTRGRGSDLPFIRYRYSEILLNAAEASFELGDFSKASFFINQVRSRAGFTIPITLNSDNGFDRIANERRVEFAFEGHFLFDMKRWRIANSVWDGSKMTTTDLRSNIGIATKRNTQPFGLLPYKYFNPGNVNHGKWLFKEVLPGRVTGALNFRNGNYYSQIDPLAIIANPKLLKQPNQ
jgi:hypothetical protein